MAGQPPFVFANPAINPPRLASPSKHHRYHSRSASRSPIRQYQARDFDPILRNLSPTSTLRAFTSNQDVSPRRNSLARSFETSSSSQRALGAKAAKACLDLRSWTRELDEWDWPGSFDLPASKRQKTSAIATPDSAPQDTIEDNTGTEEEDTAFWGSLPAQIVQQREQRTDDIAQQLDEVDVEELKGFVLAAHQEAGAGTADIDDSIGAIGAATDLRRLDDFTAIVTATILQALPYLSRLNYLLDVWTIRLSVLRHAPDFLRDLNQARTDLDDGWAYAAVQPAMNSTEEHHAMFTRSIMNEMQGIIESRVASIGRRLDEFLDDLEGREETVPELWIEGVESLEEKYAEWTVQAEKKVLENEIRESRQADQKTLAVVEEKTDAVTDATTGHETMRETHDMASDSDNVSLPDPAILAQLSLTDSRTVSPIASLRRDASPRGSTRNDLVTISAYPNAAPREPSPVGSGLDDHPVLPMPEDSERHDSSPIGLARDDSQTIPLPLANKIINDGTITPMSQSSDKENKVRHVPILLAYDGDGQEYPIEGITGDISSRAVSPAADPVKTSVPSDPEAPPISIVKKRAAFLGGVERNESLQRATKSPVRPFEHASNAFTRLFKKDRSPEHSRTRSNSARSVSSSEKRGSGSLKRGDDGIVWGGRSPVEGVRGRLNGKSVGAKPSSMSLASTPEDKPVPADKAAPPLPGAPALSKRIAEQPPMEASEPFEASQLLPTPDDESEPAEPERPKEYAFPENWPLVSPDGPTPAETSPLDKDLPPLPSDDEHDDFEGSPEIASPKIPIGSDVFHRMFVDSLPSTPSERLAASPTRQAGSLNRFAASPEREAGSLIEQATPLSRHEDDELSRAGSNLRRDEQRRSGSRVPIVEDSMLDDNADTVQAPREALPPSDEPSNRFSQFDFGSTSSMAELHREDGFTPGSVASDMSSPEIQNASIGYFPLQPSPVTSRTNSVAAASPVKLRPASSSSLSPVALRLQIPSSERTIDEDGEAVARPTLINRASMASIESHPRSELKAIDLHRRSSALAFTDSASVSPSKSEQASPISQRGLSMFPSPPNGRVSSLAGPSFGAPDMRSTSSGSGSRSPVSPLDASPDMKRGKERMASPLARSEEVSPTADRGELNSFMGKRRTQAETPKRPTSKKGHLAPSSKLEGDSFDRHVSEVLESIPAPIRFRSGRETPQPLRTSEPRNYSGPRPKNSSRLSTRTTSSSGGLTLAPAESSPKKSSHSAAEPEVKLYHLTQAGREEPIKLFVRLVGENERVMVRVGGGWADLADYLRQYAEHHGSRTVSEGNVDVQTVSAAANGTSGRRVSGPLKASPMTPVVGSRPGSKDEAGTAEGGWSTQARPQSRFSMAGLPTDVVDTPILTSPTTTTHSRPSLPTSTTTTSTPTRSSRPSTADAALSRPGSRQAWSELSTAGPGGGSASKSKGELTEHKAKWVEGMLERVTKASAEKTKEEQQRKFPKFMGEVGEMGKVGGTRRVVFRNGSGVGPQ